MSSKRVGRHDGVTERTCYSDLSCSGLYMLIGCWEKKEKSIGE